MDHAQQVPQATRPSLRLTGAPEGQVSTQQEHDASPRQVTAQLPAHPAAQVEKSSQVKLLSAARLTRTRRRLGRSRCSFLPQ
ncbi:MAG: hypothetical protein Q8S42_16570 [Archangium sp.]|nr:hypothetical protein [Archangium sp.]